MANERTRAEDPTRISENLLTIRNLTKVFGGLFGKGGKVAVNDVSVGIRPGEVGKKRFKFSNRIQKYLCLKHIQCFGWLGLNGAGKSTTFKMLTGALEVSAGGFHLPRGTLKGYCPQENALDDLLTVRETLKVYSLVRGVFWRDAERVS